jgi:hypothetical protein
LAVNSSYSQASNVPDINALLRPQRTNPAANPAKVGQTIQTVNPLAYTAALRTRSVLRSTRSAHAPDGTSRANEVTDQITNSHDNPPAEMP